MAPLKNDSRSIKKFATEFAYTYRDCFCHYSQETYVRGFAKRHFETVCAINEEEHGIKISAKNIKLFIDTFTEIQLQNIEVKKQEYIQKRKEEAEKARKGVKRKKGDN